MGDIITVGIDLAKNVIAPHGVDGSGQVVLDRVVRRERLTALVTQLPACLIRMEACTGAREWARQFAQLSHQVRLMAPKFVAPYRKSANNDDTDFPRSRGHLRAIIGAQEESYEQPAFYGLWRA
jgi:transposase